MPSPLRQLLFVLPLALTVGGCVLVTGRLQSAVAGVRARWRKPVVSGSGRAKILMIDLSGPISSEDAPGRWSRQQREHGGRVQAEHISAAWTTTSAPSSCSSQPRSLRT
jgi:hypothetical protein